MDLLLELDTTIVVELAELATELCAEPDKLELDNELDLRLLELLRLDDILLKLELILLDAELVLVCELAELDTITMTEELLWELSLDELEKLFKDPAEEDPSEEDTAALDDKGEDKDDELNTAADELVTAATEVLEKALPPPPPPQAFKKATAKHPRLSLSAREDLKGCM